MQLLCESFELALILVILAINPQFKGCPKHDEAFTTSSTPFMQKQKMIIILIVVLFTGTKYGKALFL